MSTELIESLLGIELPWRVTSVEHEESTGSIVVRVSCDRTVWCNSNRQLHVHSWETRRWRHLDLWHCKTVIEAPVPRLFNPSTGKTEMAMVPWAEAYSRQTKRFECWAIDVLLSTRNISDANRLLRLGWDATDRIMQRAVARGMSRRSEQQVRLAGVDEKSFRKGQDYISVMTDLLGSRVLEVVEGAAKEQVIALWETLSETQRQGVEAVAMDRGKSMIAGTRQAVPKADIVHDRFHISADANKAVDTVRKLEHKLLSSQGIDTLKGSKYTWLTSKDNLSEEGLKSFESLVKLNLKTARAWEIKTTLEGFWIQPDREAGAAYFKKWKSRADRSRLPAFVKLAASLKKSLPELLNYFTHRISNAMTEGFNSVIQQIKAAARGFGKFASYRARILFFCGKLDLKPSS